MAARKKDPPAKEATSVTRTDGQEGTGAGADGPRESLADLWDMVKEVEGDESFSKLKGLIYSPSGNGKSRMGAVVGDCPLIGVTEKQAIPTIQRWNPKAKRFFIRNARDVFRFRRLIHDPTLAQRHDAVVLDSLTDLQRLMKDHYTAEQSSGRSTTDRDTWGTILDATTRIVREIRDLPVHVLVLCLDAEEHEEGVGLVHRPSVSGKRLPNELAQYFNLVAYGHQREFPAGMRRQVMLNGPERYLVKNLDGLDPIEPPEPRWWIHKRFGVALPDDVRQRVEEWKRMAVEDSVLDREAATEAAPPTRVRPNDPLANLNLNT